MMKQEFETSPAAAILLERCRGDLTITTIQQPHIQAEGDDYTVKEVDGQWFINSNGDLRLRVPAASSLQIEQVDGDLALRRLDGKARIQTVNGDASLSGLAGVKLGTVAGDLALKQFTGSAHVETVNGDISVQHLADDLNVGTVSGDLSGRYISGSVSVGHAGGDVTLKYVSEDATITRCARDVNLTQVGGTVSVPRADGDIRLKGPLPAGDHTLEAGGDIVVRWPVDSPLNLLARAPKIDNRLTWSTENTKDDGAFIGTVGDGKTNLTLTAGGRIYLKAAESTGKAWESFGIPETEHDFEDLGERIAAQVSEQMARMAVEMEARFGDVGQQVAEKVMRKAEKAAERAAAQAERAQKRAHRQSGFAPPPPPPPPRRQASTEEQMKILRMVESGAITPEDANMLLEALEG